MRWTNFIHLQQAIARDIVTAKEIAHIQKALRKKKHDAEYYVTKWQKKVGRCTTTRIVQTEFDQLGIAQVKYADELAAWEKQEALLKAQAAKALEEKKNAERAKTERARLLLNGEVIICFAWTDESELPFTRQYALLVWL